MITGSQFGTVITLFVAGLLAASSGGWPSIFYVTGGSSVLWAVVWFFVGSDCPASHPRISKQEKKYIEESLIYSSAESKVCKIRVSKVLVYFLLLLEDLVKLL